MNIKLFNAYDSAQIALMVARDKEFPPGTKVRCLLTECTAIVEPGSWYADQVYTNHGHMGWRRLEKVISE